MANTALDCKLRYVIFLTLVEEKLWHHFTVTAKITCIDEVRISIPRDPEARLNSWGKDIHDANAEEYEAAFKRLIQAGIIIRLGLGKHEQKHETNDIYRLEICPAEFYIILIPVRKTFHVPQEQLDVINTILSGTSLDLSGLGGVSRKIEKQINIHFPDLTMKNTTLRTKIYGYASGRDRYGWGIILKHKPSETKPSVILRGWKVFTSLDFQLKTETVKADSQDDVMVQIKRQCMVRNKDTAKRILQALDGLVPPGGMSRTISTGVRDALVKHGLFSKPSMRTWIPVQEVISSTRFVLMSDTQRRPQTIITPCTNGEKVSPDKWKKDLIAMIDDVEPEAKPKPEKPPEVKKATAAPTASAEPTMDELQSALAEAERNVVAATRARDLLFKEIEGKKAEERSALEAERKELDRQQKEILARQSKIRARLQALN
jgi:hypothetical protein